MNSFNSISLLTQISDELGIKYREAFDDTKTRFKKESITSDGEYYIDCINKISKDEYELENLMKNQISAMTSIIKHFNETIP